MEIRDAHQNDLDAITVIYNEAITQTTAIWKEERIDISNRMTWFLNRQSAGYPVLVAVNELGEVVGCASFGDWRLGECYRYTVEHSVYVRSDHQGRGIGKALLKALIERARQIGKHVMIAGIGADNQASIHLHETFGFKQVGHVQQVGKKFGKWLDLVFMQLIVRV